MKRRALFNFNPTEENELGFREGDIIRVIEQYEDSEWWLGELDNDKNDPPKKGLFPSNYTEAI
jgi:hypothetical protein